LVFPSLVWVVHRELPVYTGRERRARCPVLCTWVLTVAYDPCLNTRVLDRLQHWRCIVFVVEVSHDGGKTWERYGSGNTRRTAEVGEVSAYREFPDALVRIRRVRS
jgi:hypothetical protein